jgi:hypothetical protein
MRKILILIIFILFFVPIVIYAQDNPTSPTSVKEVYELQERCRKSSEEWYERMWGGQPMHKDKESSMLIYYQNHYNRKLNRCLILEEVVHMPKNRKDTSLTFLNLSDVNENNKIFAHSIFTSASDPSKRTLFTSQHGVMCKVLDKTCRSWSEWESLIKPYMED